jgi:hypothetical protein
MVQCRTQPESIRARLQGQVIIIFALASLLLVGMMALAVDVGFLLAERRQVQAAADAGVMAAAHASLMNMSIAEINAAGRDYGAVNADVPEGDVQVNRPPTAGRFAGNSDYIEVVITKDVRRFFLGAVYTGDWQVTSRAVAVVESSGVNVALLALNSDSGGIHTSGSSYFETIGGSMVSNFNINASGHSTFISSEHIQANDGILRSGTVITNAGGSVNESAPEVPDPLDGLISPPVLPGSPGNIVPNVNPTNPGACATAPNWYDPSGNYVTTGTPGLYNCSLTITGANHGAFNFPNGNYRFNNTQLNLQYQNQSVNIDRGTWNFNGGNGLQLTGYPTTLDMRGGSYSFTNGARLNIGGNSYGNHIGGDFYFGGGGGFTVGGYNAVTLYPGTYIFDGGPGLNFSGNSTLNFAAGDYTFYFLNGADFTFAGSAVINANPGAYARMYFYGTNNNTSDLRMSGNSDMVMPSGQYYFDRGNFTASGSSKIRADNVFFYFTNGGYLRSNGMSGFAFSAPTTMIYPGYYPGVFLYSDASNTAEFEWTGYTNGVSRGIIYLSSSPVVMSGMSNGKVFEGQFIADRFRTSGNHSTTIEYVEYIETAVPQVYLVE